MVKGRRTFPLLEEHGYLDWGTSAPPLEVTSIAKEERSVQLYRPGATKGIALSIPEGNHSPIVYAPFRTAYLIPNGAPSTGLTPQNQWPDGKPMPIWWLTPDGTVTEQLIPYHPFMTTASHRVFLPVKGGVFIQTQDIGLGSSLRNSGGYLAKNGTTRKLIGGLLHNPVVSSDGCRVAFVHEPTFPTGVEHQYTIKLKVIDFCNERERTNGAATSGVNPNLS